MLDLEGVLFTIDSHAIKGKGIRPGAKEFLQRIIPLFDEVYLNTCVKKEKAFKIMSEQFGIGGLKYYDGNPGHPFHKSYGYEDFADAKIYHIEDGAVDDYQANFAYPERQHILDTDNYFIPVRFWGTMHYKPITEDFRAVDNDLERVLKEVKKLI